MQKTPSPPPVSFAGPSSEAAAVSAAAATAAAAAAKDKAIIKDDDTKTATETTRKSTQFPKMTQTRLAKEPLYSPLTQFDQHQRRQRQPHSPFASAFQDELMSRHPRIKGETVGVDHNVPLPPEENPIFKGQLDKSPRDEEGRSITKVRISAKVRRSLRKKTTFLWRLCCCLLCCTRDQDTILPKGSSVKKSDIKGVEMREDALYRGSDDSSDW